MVKVIPATIIFVALTVVMAQLVHGRGSAGDGQSGDDVGGRGNGGDHGSRCNGSLGRDCEPLLAMDLVEAIRMAEHLHSP